MRARAPHKSASLPSSLSCCFRRRALVSGWHKESMTSASTPANILRFCSKEPSATFPKVSMFGATTSGNDMAEARIRGSDRVRTPRFSDPSSDGEQGRVWNEDSATTSDLPANVLVCHSKTTSDIVSECSSRWRCPAAFVCGESVSSIFTTAASQAAKAWTDVVVVLCPNVPKLSVFSMRSCRIVYQAPSSAFRVVTNVRDVLSLVNRACASCVMANVLRDEPIRSLPKNAIVRKVNMGDVGLETVARIRQEQSRAIIFVLPSDHPDLS